MGECVQIYHWYYISTIFLHNYPHKLKASHLQTLSLDGKTHQCTLIFDFSEWPIDIQV